MSTNTVVITGVLMINRIDVLVYNIIKDDDNNSSGIENEERKNDIHRNQVMFEL